MWFKKFNSVLLIIAVCFGVVAVSAKRMAPDDVPPVVYQGVKYTAPHWGLVEGKKQNGGFIEARDLISGKLLWELRVYEIKYDPKMEGDVQDIFITSLKIIDGNLEVRNEAHDTFLVDISKREVIKGKGRVYQRKHI